MDKDPATANSQYCSDKCAGDPREMCGGVSHESVYVMIKCEVMPPSAVEVRGLGALKKTKTRRSAHFLHFLRSA